MPAQALFFDHVYHIKCLRYTWTEDGLVLLTLDCYIGAEDSEPMTFAELRREVGALCVWQRILNVTIGTKHAIVEVLTLYHAFESARHHDRTLMLVSTPPDEYFEGLVEAA